ncbi:MAG: C45 family peptidase [Chromatiaceae bacterium]|nr:C45 family peptidase [Chromatiaceae bacterium]
MSAPRVLALTGTPREFGRAHGETFRDQIRRYTAERVALAGSAQWTGHALPRAAVLALAEACIPEHTAYAPDLMDELAAIAEAADLSVAELIITNGFTDFIDLVYARGGGIGVTSRAQDDCTAFIIPEALSADSHGLFGQTWDMHASSAPYVVLLSGRPAQGPAFLAFSLTGCVGMIGMNDAGIAIGINNLLGAQGQIGVTWPFVVRKALQQTDIEAALACITTAQLVGAHNFQLFDRHGTGINVEAMPGYCDVTRSDGTPMVHSNHCLAPQTLARCRPRAPASQASSEARLARARQLLAGGAVTVEALMALTRDPVICVRAEPPLDMQTCGAAIMQPASGLLWAVQGLPVDNEYARFSV